MAKDPKLLAQIQLVSGANTILTVPGATTYLILYMSFSNITGADQTADITAGDSGSEMELRGTFTVPGAGDPVEWSGFLVLEAADVLKSTASASSAIQVLVSGVSIT